MVLFAERIKRFFLVIPVLFVIAALAWTYAIWGRSTTTGYEIMPFTVITLFIVVGVFGIWWIEYQKKTYDPTWVLKYQSIFDAMLQERSEAAKVLLKYIDNKSFDKNIMKEFEVVDNVLDILDDLGFYVKGLAMSSEVVYHHFYHWIRLYYQSSESYIDEWQIKEHARWGHIKYLFKQVTQLEAQGQKCPPEGLRLPKERLEEYLIQEKEMTSD